MQESAPFPTEENAFWIVGKEIANRLDGWVVYVELPRTRRVFPKGRGSGQYHLWSGTREPLSIRSLPR